jgi:hypothetical protein
MRLAAAAGLALGFLAPPSRVEELALEMEEEVELRLGHEPKLQVAAWCLSQVLGSIVPLLVMRLRRREADDVQWSGTVGALALGSAGLVAALHALGDFVRSQVPMREGLEPMAGWLVATLLAGSAGSLVAGAVLPRLGRSLGPVHAALAGVAAAVAISLVTSLTVALLPAWYRAAFWLVPPVVAAAAARLARVLPSGGGERPGTSGESRAGGTSRRA